MAQRSYFVWRDNARQPYRTYRVRRRRQPPTANPNLLWQGDDYQAGLRVQKAANRLASLRRDDHPNQLLLFGDWLASFANPDLGDLGDLGDQNTSKSDVQKNSKKALTDEHDEASMYSARM